MKIPCPTCSQAIPVDDIALDAGWAKCRRCNEVFQLTGVLPGYAPPAKSADAVTGVPSRPFDAWAITERTADKLKIHVPAQGMRAATWGVLFFASFWLAFIAFWTAGALGIFGGNKGGIHPVNAVFAAFSTPFWLVGVGMMGSVLWMARGTRTVYLDPTWLYTEKRCLLWRRRRTIDRSQVQFARVGEVKVSSNRQTAGYPQNLAEIVFTRGSFTLPCSTLSERDWLIPFINDFLQQVPYRPSPYGDDVPTSDFRDANGLSNR